MRMWFSRMTKSTGLALIAIGVTVSIAWAAVEWLPNSSNTDDLIIRAPYTRFLETNSPGIIVDPGANQDDVIDFGPGDDWILFGGEDSSIQFSSSEGLNEDSIEYIAGASSTNDLITVNGDSVIVDATVGDLNLSGIDSAFISTGDGGGPFIYLNPVTGEAVLQMGP